MAEQVLADDVLDESVNSDADWIPSIERYTITSYGADYPVDSLVKRLTSDPDDEDSDIYMPDFQRGWVWTRPQAERFIESLLLGLPVPGIFLSRDEKTKKLFVIDGQQRLRTIGFFYDGIIEGREFTLASVHDDFVGKSYKTLEPEDRRRLDDSIIHATIVHQDHPEGERSIFYLFERINTGGTAAQPHEVRRAVYGGTFNMLLSHLDEDEAWRAMYGPSSKRMKDQELILRFLALNAGWESYSGTMKEFLNQFMAVHRNVDQKTATRFETIFLQTTGFIQEHLEGRPFRPERTLNAAVFDAVMVGLASRLESGPVEDVPAFNKAYAALLEDEAFIAAATTGTSQEANVKARIRAAIEAFAAVS